MRKSLRRALVVTLIFSIGTGVVAGCGSNEVPLVKVPEDFKPITPPKEQVPKSQAYGGAGSSGGMNYDPLKGPNP